MNWRKITDIFFIFRSASVHAIPIKHCHKIMVLSTSLQSQSLHFRLCLFLLACLVGVRNHQGVDAANVFVWTPSISLSANFGVAEGLCPDIRGYGAGLNCDSFLQLHTCKSQGEDTQFAFDFLTNEIRSVNYDSSCQSITDGVDSKGACITIDGNVDVGDKLRLALCNQGADQRFEFTAADGRIRPTANSNLCLAKTSAVGPAGSNERTDFALADCLTADPLDITWTVSSSMIVEEPYADDPAESSGPPIVPSPSTTSTSAASRIPSEGPSKIVNKPPSPNPTVRLHNTTTCSITTP